MQFTHNEALQLTAKPLRSLVPSAFRATAATELRRWAARENIGTYIKRQRFFLGVIVPEVSRFYGIIIALYYNDHAPAHSRALADVFKPASPHMTKKKAVRKRTAPNTGSTAAIRN